jgi:hypothetical protein
MNLTNKITLKEARIRYGVAESTVRCQREKFKTLEKVGTTWIISEKEIKEWAIKREQRRLAGLKNKNKKKSV